jgi:hypothetical protein
VDHVSNIGRCSGYWGVGGFIHNLAWTVPTIVGLELSVAVGLNMTLPVLAVALLGLTHNDHVALAPGYSVLGQGWAIAILVLIASFEITAGKHVSQSLGFNPYVAPDAAAAPRPVRQPGVARLITLPVASATAVMLAAAIATNHGELAGLGLFIELTASAVLAFTVQMTRIWLRSRVLAAEVLLPFSAGEDLAALAVVLTAALAPYLPLVVGLLACLLNRRVRRLLRINWLSAWPGWRTLRRLPGALRLTRSRRAGSRPLALVDSTLTQSGPDA